MAIRCQYCGDTHADAAGVRACWSAAQPSAPPGAEDAGTEGGSWADAPNTRIPASAGIHPEWVSPGRPAPFLGRSLLVSPGAPVPEPWKGRPRVKLSNAAPANGVLEEVESAFYARSPLVIEVNPDWEPTGLETESSPAWSLSPDFSFPGERLRHAALSNALDGRGEGEPGWRWSAAALGAGALSGGPADVLLPDGRPALVDGGPLSYLAAAPGFAGSAVVPRVTVEHGRLTPLHTNVSPSELAPDQQAAVTHSGGSARILAPAGSGKTRVLTERARHLLKGWRVPAEALCLVAFNKRAAEEMKERTTDLPGLQIRTLNSLGLAILSGSGRFGSGRSVETIDESAVRRILEDLVSFPRRTNTDPAAAWIEALSAVRLGLGSPERVEAEFQGDVDGLAEVFHRYRRVLEERRVVDFDEQIYRAIEVLLTNPQLRHRARLACRVMLVDEFQDLTPAHLLLIRLLAGPEGSVFGVGDDDQTIYGYAGATPGWLIDFGSYFPGSGSHLLQVNYRCPAAVTEAARTLLTHNRRRVHKAIVSPPDKDPDEVGAEYPGLTTEITEDPVAVTVASVRSKLDEGDDPASIAVLTRVNSSLAPVQLSLLECGIPVNRAVDGRFLERTGARAALGWLKLATNPQKLRAPDVVFTARRPPRALSPKVIEWMSEQRSVDRLRYLAGRLGERDGMKVNSYADDLERLIAVAREGRTDVILRFLRDEIGLAAAISALDNEHRRLDRSPQTDDLDALIALGAVHPDPHGFEEWLRDGLNTPGDPYGVTLATIHAVKGREWDHVVVHNATAGLIPHRLAFDVEEERRVFHVALTRCRLSSTVVAGVPESPFVDELFSEWQPDRTPVTAERATQAAGAESPSPADNPQAERAAKMLRAWRLEKARAEGRPAYTVFHDSTLEAIAASDARTLGDLARIKGVGPAKLENFGDEILAVLDSVAQESRGL
ncbi:MAG TPA: ATP-dependent DNA helicase UvrD2 [Actinomycetota bacterium]|nr:ATP-dependent DNA helicase UvrD2 [Actinomycetota bacterium]